MHLNYYTTVALAFSIYISGIIAIVRFKQIPEKYRPFVYLIWIGCINEVISVYLAFRYHNNIICSIIYTLIESLFFLWFFKKLKLFDGRNKKWLYFLVVLFVGIWIANSFFTDSFATDITYYFDIVYAFCLVILSIRVINNLLFTERDLIKNPAFLICIGLVIFFTYQIIQRMFGLAGLKSSYEFRSNVQVLLYFINFLVNLIFALAVLWMRKKQAFTLQF